MSRHSFLLSGVAAMLVVGSVAAQPVVAEVIAVPEAVRQLRAPKEEHNLVRSPAGQVLGEQRVQAVVTGDQLGFDVTTRFATGEEWDEHGELDLADGFRSRVFQKVVRRSGQVTAEQHVDFATGKIAWLVDGVHAEKTMTFTPDTYIGPMLAMVLAGAAEKAATTSFQTLVFRPDPAVFTLRAEPVDHEDLAIGSRIEPTTKMRVKADLGALKNVMFASLIPTHYFWFSREPAPEFRAFEGALANGLEVMMVPETPATTTAGLAPAPSH